MQDEGGALEGSQPGQLLINFSTVSPNASRSLGEAAARRRIRFVVALLFGIYIPELFPTAVRLRGAGICNTFGRGATIVTPFVVVSLFNGGGVAAVTELMAALLAVQIVVVLLFGIEPAARRLEDVEPVGDITGAPLRVGP